MLLHCPACQAAFPGVSRCPRCGGLLLMPHEVSPEAPHKARAEPPPPVRPTAMGRVFVGVVLAMGLYLALRKLAVGTVLVVNEDPAGWWMSLKGLVAVHASQALAVAFGGVLAAAGRGQSSPLGMLVGGVCGGLFLAYELLAGAPPQDLVLYLQLPVLAMFGLIAGTAGGRFWGAAPKIEVPILSASALSSLRLLEEEKPAPGRPTAWLRVMAGAAVIVLGVTVADHLREGAQHFSGGLLRVRGPVQGEFVSWQLAAFAVLLGGMISGANTGAGTWHGFLSGVLGAIGVYALCANTGGPLPPVDFWLETLGLGGLPLFNAGVIGGVMGGIVLASLLGGWLGGALLVPLAPEHMRRRLRGGLD